MLSVNKKTLKVFGQGQGAKEGVLPPLSQTL